MVQQETRTTRIHVSANRETTLKWYTGCRRPPSPCYFRHRGVLPRPSQTECRHGRLDHLSVILPFFSPLLAAAAMAFPPLLRISRPSSFFIRIKTEDFIPFLLKSCLIQPSAIVCRASPYIMKQKAAVKIQDVIMLSSSSPTTAVTHVRACVMHPRASPRAGAMLLPPEVLSFSRSIKLALHDAGV